MKEVGIFLIIGLVILVILAESAAQRVYKDEDNN